MSTYTPPLPGHGPLSFGPPYTPPLAGHGPLSLGSDVVGQTITPVGFGGEAFGTPYVNGPQQVLPVSLGDTSAYGHPSLKYGQLFLYPSGYVNTSFGTASLQLQNRPVAPSGWDAFGGFGTAWVSYYVRRLTGVGLGDQSQFGTAALAGGVRTIDLAGNGIASQAFGNPTAWFALRQLYPQGYVATLFGNAQVDRHHQVNPSGFGGEMFGTPEVYHPRFIVDLAGLGIPSPGFGNASVSNYWQFVQPQGFLAIGQTEVDRFGRGEVYNLTQYIQQLFEVTPSDGGVFGDFNLVENRNKVIKPDPILATRYGTPDVRNNARIITTPPFQDFSAFGTTLVAYRNRSISTIGADSSQFGSPLNMIVYNAARQLYPHGWQEQAFGTADFFANRQFVKQVGIDQSLYGTPMVAYAIRTVAPFAIPGDFPFGLTTVQNKQRYLAPPGLDAGGFGVPTLEEHFTIIKPASVLPPSNQVSGGGRVYNKTPQLYQQGAVMSEYGTPAVHNQFETYAMQGFDAVIFGTTVVEFRTKTLGVKGWNQLYIPTTHQVRNVNPDPPATRTIAAQGADTSAMGLPLVRGNALFPVGFVATSYGTPSIRSNGLLPVGIPPPYAADTGSQFGNASLNRSPLAFPEGFETLGWGLPDVGPRYIWAPMGYPYTTGYWQERGELMDNRFIGNNNPARPFFGLATVTHRNRTLSGVGGDFYEAFGQPSLALRLQYIRPTGPKLQRFGIPVLNGGGGFQPVGFDMARYGTPKVAFPPYTGPQTVSPVGLAAGVFGDNEVQNFNRNIYPQGWVEFKVSDPVPPSWPRSSTWVSHAYDPFPMIGFDASSFGTPWVSFRVRSIFPVGSDTALVAEYTPGNFADRMRVTKRLSLGGLNGISVGSTGAMGTPTIALRLRNLLPFGIGAGGMGQASVRRINRVNVSGWDALLFGDVQRWEAGKIKLQGEDHSVFGNARFNRAIFPQGWSGDMGMPSVASNIGAAGIAPAGMGQPTLTANWCGPRAVAAAGFAAGAFGTPEVTV